MAAPACTRSIKLKLVLPRAPEQAQACKALWTTHAAINAACRYYEEQLVAMRGLAYETRSGRVGEEQPVAVLLEQARAAQMRNRNEVAGSDQEIVDLLQQLYADIVPSAIGEDDGTAQAANAFLSPLTDGSSRGFLEVFDKLDAAPNWLTARPMSSMPPPSGWRARRAASGSRRPAHQPAGCGWPESSRRHRIG